MKNPEDNYAVVQFKGYAMHQSEVSSTCEYFLAQELGLCNVMQLFDGQTIASFPPQIKRDRRCLYQLKVEIVKEICRAVESIHRNKSYKIAHGDIHETNILVMPDGKVKLTDVGSSIVRTEAKDGSMLTQFRRREDGSSLPGGQRYQPPEIMRGDVKTSTRSADIFQLGWTILSIFMANSWGKSNEDPSKYPYEQCPRGRLQESVYRPTPNPPPEPSFPQEIEDNFLLKHLLQNMLAYDDQARPLIRYVLNHPFFLSLDEKEKKLRYIDGKLELPPTTKNELERKYVEQNICQMRTTVPFVANEYLDVDYTLKGNNTMDDINRQTTMKWRNCLSTDIPDIFKKTPRGPQQNSTEYFHVRTDPGYQNLYDYEEHGPIPSNLVNDPVLLKDALDHRFYKRFHAVVRFSRNMLEHFKEKDDSIKEIYDKVIQSKAGWKSDYPTLRNFVFLHPGLNWILPALWETTYKTLQYHQIEDEEFANAWKFLYPK